MAALRRVRFSVILLHGTTRLRAELIWKEGPNPRYHEEGGQDLDGGFSMNLQEGPSHFGSVEKYARNKARNFPDEGGPVILAVDIPAEIIEKATDEFLPISQGLVQFDHGFGLEELLEAWPTLAKEIRDVL
jgi:hypothetical protein